MAIRLLSDLKPREKARIVRVVGKGGAGRRILDMGAVSGTEVEVERVAPLGDPIEITLRGYHLTLRQAEAAAIQVEVM